MSRRRSRRPPSWVRALARWLALSVAALGTAHCGHPSPPSPEKIAPTELRPEAGLVDVPSRDVTLHGKAVHLAARARLFYNLRPADEGAEDKPIFVLSNGFSARIVRAFGTGPTTVAEGGEVVANPSSLTKIANLLYLDPRQSGFSYDVIDDRAATLDDCGADVFNEYVDASDMLFATLRVLEAHPELRGPIYWVGESYAGVRIQWILAYLRGRWGLAPYDDPALRSELARTTRLASLHAGQILLQPWLVGRGHAEAIAGACGDPMLTAEVEKSIGTSCLSTNACACAETHGRSRYNYQYETGRQRAREIEASQAHVLVDRAAKLFGVPLAGIDGLGAADRARGFKCNIPDSDTPPDDALVALWGALPMGQSYFIAYSPLQPGKEIQPAKADWSTENFVGAAFVDNLDDVPTFVTNGPLDLVVPTRALVPALAKVVGPDHVAQESASRIRVDGSFGPRFIDVGTYPSAGHMVTMLDAEALSRDLATWLANRTGK